MTDVNLLGTLKKISAQQASKKISPNWNSIWEITNHIISWRENVLERVQGRVLQTPADNYFSEIRETTEKDWKETLKKLEDSQQQWLQVLKEFNEDNFSKIYPNNQMTYYEHIHGILQHDAYHLGQIVLLAKVV
jgi:uncharacterized damage-inducible protein DinB